VLYCDLPGLPLHHRGKVRDVFSIPAERLPAGSPDGNYLLMVATDRLSAFDVILPDGIDGKGELLCQLSNFWFAQTAHLLPNHLTGIDVAAVLPEGVNPQAFLHRSVVVRQLQPVPVEAIVRGYLIGSGWQDYLRQGQVSGIALPPGLCQAQQLSEPIFTPSTKAAVGDHDEAIDFSTLTAKIGTDLAEQIREASLQIYRFAAAHALQRGIILADTKFEFGLDENGQLHLMDELLTPDSSRYWPVEDYQVGISPPSYDKQIVRDWLETQDWDKTPPGPKLPQEVMARTRARYAQAVQVLTGLTMK